jgi:hypothetical protein
MSKIDLQPTEEMISAGISELIQVDEYRHLYHSGEGPSDDELKDLVVFIWQAMVSKVNK